MECGHRANGTPTLGFNGLREELRRAFSDTDFEAKALALAYRGIELPGLAPTDLTIPGAAELFGALRSERRDAALLDLSEEATSALEYIEQYGAGARESEVSEYVSRIRKESSKRRLAHRLRNAVDQAVTSNFDTFNEELRDAVEEVQRTLHISEEGLGLIRASDVEEESVEWLLQDVIPLATFVLLTGHPDLGKSLLTLELASMVTRGVRDVRGESDSSRSGKVLLFSSEDSLSKTIRPRLAAAGAKLDEVFLYDISLDPSERPFSLDGSLARLESEISRHGSVRLVVFDPIGAFIDKVSDRDNTNLRRRIFARLKAIAEEKDLTIIGLNHHRKSSEGAPHEMALGSVAFSAAARAHIAVVEDKNEQTNLGGCRRLVLMIKGNLAKIKRHLAYVIEESEKDGPPVLRWVDASDLRDADVLELVSQQAKSKRGPKPIKSEKARLWLSKYLGKGGRKLSEIVRAGRAQRLGQSTVKNMLRDDPQFVSPKRGWWELDKNRLDDSQISPNET